MNLSFSNINLSKNDLIKCNWEEVVNNSDKKICNYYSRGFRNKSQEAEQDGDTQLQFALALLSGITSLALKSESINSPFASIDFVNQISNEHLKALQDWVLNISDAELKARVADLLWVRKRDYRMAQIAVDSYLISAKFLEDPKHWSSSVDRIERAIRLAYQANQKNHKRKTVDHIESVLKKYNGEDPLFLSAKLMELLQEFKQGNPTLYAPLAEKLARNSETECNWRKARNYWRIASVWHQKNQDSNKKRSACIFYAETYVKEAEYRVNQTSQMYLSASIFLIKAIEAFRNIDGSQNRIEELHKKLIDYQQKSTTELQTFSQKVDVSDIAGQFINYVKGKDLDEALFTLAFIFEPTKLSEVRQLTQATMEESPLRFIFSNITVNEMGKIIGQNPSLEDEIYKNAIWYQNGQVQAAIEPARYQINLEHYVKVSDFYSLVADNPFVPRGREEIYARGLHAGLIGDFLVAAHLLIPQIEHSLRCLVKRQGAITSWLDKGIQDEHIMSVLFDQHKADLEAIFGEDIVFNLIALLNRKGFGSNLRNLMAHGLISTEDFYRSPIVYLWWLTLRLCYSHIIPENNSLQINEPQ